MCYQREPGEGKKLRLKKTVVFKNKRYDVTLQFFQLINYKGRKRYIVT